jgi:hypothetical protein
MPYAPGDNWVICDISGRKFLMSKSRKTWDGLRVHPDYWYPRHPQLDLRAIPDRQAVIDGRPRPPDLFVGPEYSWGTFCLISPNGTTFVVYVADDGALLVRKGLFGSPITAFYLGNFALTVEDDGALLVRASPVGGPPLWKMVSPGGAVYDLSVAADGALKVTPSVWYQ